MTVGNRFTNSAKRNINRYGKYVRYRKKGEDGVYDPVTRTVTQGPDTDISLKAFETEVRFSESQSPNLIGKDSCAFLIVGAELGVIPEEGDIIYTLKQYPARS